MRVEDVLTPHTCVCRTEEGRLLDGMKHSGLEDWGFLLLKLAVSFTHLSVSDIRQKMLETIVPKNDSDYIMVVLGEHKRQVYGFTCSVPNPHGPPT